MRSFEDFFLKTSTFFEALKNSFFLLHPLQQAKNPILFSLFVSTIFTIGFYLLGKGDHPLEGAILFWILITLLLANFAEGIAETLAKNQMDLKKVKPSVFVKVFKDGKIQPCTLNDLRLGDILVASAGDSILVDGEIIEGVATVDESAITGESAPVLRESDGERSTVTAGTRVLSDQIFIRVASLPGSTSLDEKILLTEERHRKKTPNEIALFVIFTGLTLLFLFSTVFLKSASFFSERVFPNDSFQLLSIPILIACFVCLIPITPGALFSAVAISGIRRLFEKKVISRDELALETAADIELLVLDKTGTITLGNRTASSFIPAPGIDEKEFAEKAQLASLTDETPEGRSIVVLAKSLFGLRLENIDPKKMRFIPFTSESKMSGLDEFLQSDNQNTIIRYRKGAADAVREYIENLGGVFPEELNTPLENISREGGTPLVLAENERVLGIIQLTDPVKGGIREKFQQIRQMGIKTTMLTGDNPLTAAAIAAEAGVDDFVANATPEKKLQYIQREQKKGFLVAMIGNAYMDAPALAQADIGVATRAGPQTSREAGNLIDLEGNPAKLIDIVEIGKQLLMTRGTLTIFAWASSIGKFFALIPAIFATLGGEKMGELGPLASLNFMKLSSPESAILSTLIFSALCIPLVLPVALWGFPYKKQAPHILFRNHFLLCFFSGLILPFVGIKLIDMVVAHS